MITADTFVPTSNGFPVPFDEDHFAPMRDSTELLGDIPALRERYRRDGYLLLRGVLDSASVRQLRKEYFSLYPDTYFLPGTPPGEGIYSGRQPEGLPPYGVAGHPAHDFVRGESFAAFTTQPRLAEMARAALGQPVTLLPRRVLRHFDLDAKQASRVHVDRAYPSGGSELVTIWIPIGDCPLTCGGIVYLEGSHQTDKSPLTGVDAITDRPQDRRAYSSDLGWTAERLGRRWLWTDFQAGDVALHCPDLVHASLDATTAVMRLSTDIRFQRRHDPVRPGWTRAWAADDGE